MLCRCKNCVSQTIYTMQVILCLDLEETKPWDKMQDYLMKTMTLIAPSEELTGGGCRLWVWVTSAFYMSSDFCILLAQPSRTSIVHYFLNKLKPIEKHITFSCLFFTTLEAKPNNPMYNPTARVVEVGPWYKVVGAPLFLASCSAFYSRFILQFSFTFDFLSRSAFPSISRFAMSLYLFNSTLSFHSRI